MNRPRVAGFQVTGDTQGRWLARGLLLIRVIHLIRSCRSEEYVWNHSGYLGRTQAVEYWLWTGGLSRPKSYWQIKRGPSAAYEKSSGTTPFYSCLPPGFTGVRLLCISYLEMPSSVKTEYPTTVWQSTEGPQPIPSLVPSPIPPPRHAMRRYLK